MDPGYVELAYAQDQLHNRCLGRIKTLMAHDRQINLRQLSIFLIMAIASLFFWLTPALSPLKIFVVFIHETFHALVTVLTGGRVISMVVTPWQSGYVQHRGGNPLLIAAAGYVGSALFGGLLLLLSVRNRWAPAVFGGLALLFGTVTLWFVRNPFGLVFGLGTTAVFAFLSWKTLPGAHYLIDFLAVMSSLYAIYDLTDFLLVGARTDAVILAEITPVPAFIWALLWSAVSLMIVYLAGKRAITLR
jgi:hypothetical protein